ncbi:hypothetical protein WDW89_11605 [Deltaproteobacteria bacterium TL4]
MKLKTIFKLNLFIAFFMVLLSGGILGYTAHEIRNALTLDEINEDIAYKLFELNLLKNEYIRRPNERIRTQWNAQYELLGHDLKNSLFTERQSQQIVGDIQKNYLNLKLFFDQLIQAIQLRHAQDYKNPDDLEERLIGQLSIQSQLLLDFEQFAQYYS